MNSIFTWNNRLKIFKEVYRVLAPGGSACFCGGFEPVDIQARVNTHLAEVNPQLVNLFGKQVYTNQIRNFEKILAQAAIPSFKITGTANGLWLVFAKPTWERVSRGPVEFTYFGPPNRSEYA